MFSQPGNAYERMPFGWAVFLIRVTLIIHVVQQAHRFPQTGVGILQPGEMFHRVRDCITVFAERLRLNPIVQNG
jgi:hypothetical protein